MRKPSKKLEDLLGHTFDSAAQTFDDPALDEERRRDFIFHMTDWIGDLEELAKLYKHPQKANRKEATTFLIGCVSHMTGHLNAACRLLLDEPFDPFNALPKKPRRKKAKSAQIQ